MEQNQAFREAVTSASFTLNLSRTMVQTLASVHFNSRAMGVIAYPQWCGAIQALHRRGLLTTTDLFGRFSDSPHTEVYRLTEPGKLVVRLCQIAGLIPQKLPQQETVG